MTTAMRVLVTGGTSGLGRAMAAALAASGATVALTGRSAGRAAAVAAELPGAAGIELDEVTPRMLAVGSGRIVNISVNHSTMHRAGFVPYGPSRAGSEALSRVMAADLRDTGVTVNLLLPGGATATGMLPEPPPQGRAVLDPAVMGPPIVWLASGHAAGVHDERIVAAEFERWLRERG